MTRKAKLRLGLLAGLILGTYFVAISLMTGTLPFTSTPKAAVDDAELRILKADPAAEMQLADTNEVGSDESSTCNENGDQASYIRRFHTSLTQDEVVAQLRRQLADAGWRRRAAERGEEGISGLSVEDLFSRDAGSRKLEVTLWDNLQMDSRDSDGFNLQIALYGRAC